MTAGNLIVGTMIALYGGAVALFYMKEKDLLIASLNTYAPVTVGTFETASVLALLSFMTLGYLSGLKKLIFALFIYHAPLKLLRGEYERYFSDTSAEGTSRITIALGFFLLAFSVSGFIGLKYHVPVP